MSTQYDHTLKALQQGANRHGRRLVVAGLLVMLLFLLVWQASEQGTIRDREFNRLSTQSGIIYHDLRRQLMSIRASHTNLQAELLSGAKTFESVRPDIEKRLSAFVQTINGVRTVTLLDAKASVLASSNPQQQKGNSLEDNELVLRVMQGAQPGILYISRPYPLAENMLTIAVASMLMDERGEFSGMVVTELSPLETGILLSSVVYAEDMHAGIVHADGTVFLAEPVMQKLLGHNLADPQSAFTEHVHSGNELSLYHGKQLYSDDRRLIVQQTIMPAELNISDALIVRISRNHDAVFAKLHRSRWFMAGLYLALVVSSVVFLRLWQRKSRQAFTNLSNTQKQLVASNGMLARLNRQLEQQTENMRSLAFLDELAGIANRRHFNRSLEAEWHRCLRERQPLSMVMLDVDYFKQFNDLYGHQRGDDCLVCIAGSLKNSLTRSHDLPARIGGEEFACLLPNTPLEGALIKAERIRSEIEALAIPHGGSLAGPVVTVSVGVACVIPEAGNGYLGLLEAADGALYRAKHEGRNQVYSGAAPELISITQEGAAGYENLD